MVYTKTAGLRDREQNKFAGDNTGSICLVGVMLYAMQSGTTTAIPVQCNANGMLLTSGI